MLNESKVMSADLMERSSRETAHRLSKRGLVQFPIQYRSSLQSQHDFFRFDQFLTPHVCQVSSLQGPTIVPCFSLISTAMKLRCYAPPTASYIARQPIEFKHSGSLILWSIECIQHIVSHTIHRLGRLAIIRCHVIVMNYNLFKNSGSDMNIPKEHRIVLLVINESYLSL